MALSVFDRADATFEYPSIATTSEYCIGFWSNAPIPAEVFRQFAAAQAQQVETEARNTATDELWEWRDSFGENEPENSLIEAKWIELLRLRTEESTSQRMDPRDVPIIARAALMYHNAPSEAHGSEREAVLDYEVELTTGPTTIEELVERYGTEEIYESVSTMPPPAPAVDQNVVEMITELRGSLAKLDALDALDEIRKQNDKNIQLQQTIALGAQRQMDKMNDDRANAMTNHRLQQEADFNDKVAEAAKFPWQRNKN